MNTSVLLLILGLVARGFSLSCPLRCDPPPFGCRYGVTTGPCGCDECAVGPGEECGGPFQIDNCADGLECQEPSAFDHNGLPGVCVHRAPPGGSRGSSVEWSPLVNACIRGHNNRVEDNVLSIADCKNLCQNERSFTCRSVELNDKRCVLSDANSDFFEYEQPCSQPNHGSGWIYSEVKVNNCPRGPSYQDDCNTCTCGGNGGYACTLIACGPAEFSIGHQRFAVLADKKGLNWWQAQTACQNRGYELAQPDDLISLSQYVATNYGLTDYWLGGYSTPTNIPVWLNGNIIPYDRDLWRTEYNAARGHCTYLKDATIPTRFGNSPGILGNWECSQRQYMTPLCELPGSGFPHGLVLYSLAPAPAAAAPAPAASFAPVPVAAAPVPAAAFAPPVPPPVALEGAGSIPE